MIFGHAGFDVLPSGGLLLIIISITIIYIPYNYSVPYYFGKLQLTLKIPIVDSCQINSSC